MFLDGCRGNGFVCWILENLLRPILPEGISINSDGPISLRRVLVFAGDKFSFPKFFDCLESAFFRNTLSSSFGSKV